MNYRLCFTLNEKDNIRCYIKKDGKQIKISLPQKRLKKILDAAVANYPKHQEYFENDIEYLMFNHIKAQEAEYLLNESHKYNKTRKKVQSPKKKVHRQNKILRQTAIFTTATILLLTGIGLTGDKDNKNDENDENMSLQDNYASEIVLPKQDENDYVLYYENNEIVEKGKIEENTNPIEQNTNAVVENATPVEKNTGKQDISPAESNVDETIKLELDFDLQGDEEKYNYAKENYYSIIEKYGNMYGVDPQLCLALFSHERGYHSEVVDGGGAVGLCQIQVEGGWNWNEKDVTAYNFDTNSYETFHITMNGENDVRKIENNIKAGVMILQSALRQENYLILQGIQSYNYGADNVNKVLNSCVQATGIAKDKLKEQKNIDWLPFRDIIKGGDPNYIENVFKYIEDGTKLIFKTPNGETISFIYSNLNKLTNSHSKGL